MKQLVIIAASALALTACGGSGPSEPVDQVKFETGAEAFRVNCASCHAVVLGSNMTGPHLYDTVGRKAGSVRDFEYSEDMANSGITWTKEELDAFITDPLTYMDGTLMGAAPIDDPETRDLIIYYLEYLPHIDD